MPLTRITGNVITDGTITNADISPTAAISSSKINFIDIVDVKAYGAQGNGIADDTAAVQAAFTAAAPNSLIFFPEGVYRISDIQITKNVSIRGEGQNSTFIQLRNSSDWRLFTIAANGIDVYASDFTLRDTHGFRIFPTANFCSNATNTFGFISISSGCVRNYPKSVYFERITFLDLYNSMEVECFNADVWNCKILYTYGAWGLGAQWDNGVYSHPLQSAIIATWNLNFCDNYCDCLVDDTFSGVTPAALTRPNAKKPADGLIYTTTTRQSSTFLPFPETIGQRSVFNIHNNILKSNGIEGIFVDSAVKNQTEKNYHYVNIIGNQTQGTRQYYGTPPSQPAEWAVGNIGIIVNCYYYRPNITISDNVVESTSGGISVSNLRPNDIPLSSFTGIWSNQGVTKITNNKISQCTTGILSTWNIPQDVIANNTIILDSAYEKYMKRLFPTAQQWLGGSQSNYSQLLGITIVNGNPVVTDNNMSAKYEWEQIKTITGNSSNVLTLNNTTGMAILNTVDNVASCLVPYGGVAWHFPITNISGNNVTIAIDWWNSFNTYWSTRGGFDLNGTQLYFTTNSLGAYKTSAIYAILNQGGGGNGWVTPPPLDKVFNNTISGFYRDITNVDSTASFLPVVNFGNMTSKDVYQKTYKVNFPTINDPSISNMQGFYLET